MSVRQNCDGGSQTQRRIRGYRGYETGFRELKVDE